MKTMRLHWLSAAALAALLAQAATAETVRQYKVEVAPQRVQQALKDFARQTSLQVVYYTEVAEGISSPGATGNLSADDALKKILHGTGLDFVFVNDRTVSIRAAGKSAADSAPSHTSRLVAVGPSVRLAQSEENTQNNEEQTGKGKKPESSPESSSKDSRDGEDSHVVEVTGSRIRSLLGEKSFTPMVTFTRQDIERAGVSTIGELSRLIPQAYSQGSYDGLGMGGQSMGQDVTSDGSLASSTSASRSTFNLRGLGTQNTLVLVNGRRVAKTGIIRSNQPNEASDLAGIPISSIERVEVLTDGASAIYGSDAVGGVINIIQRRDYSGTEVSLTHENTFDTDTGLTTATLSRDFTVGRLSASLSGTYQTRNAFAAVDREFSATDNWVPLGGTRAPSINGFVVGAGLVRAASGNLPGTTGASSPYALIPTGADGSMRPASDYISVPNTPSSLAAWAGDPAQYAQIITKQTTRALSTRMNYAVSDRMDLFFDGRYSETFTPIKGLPVTFRNGMTVPAGYPGNPFNTSVILYKTFWELGAVQGAKDAETSNTSFSTGLTGVLGDWRYQTGIDWNRGVLRDKNVYDPVLNDTTFIAARDGAAPPVLFYDSRSFAPNDSARMLSFLRPGNRLDIGGNMGLTASVDGPLFNLPAGAVRVALGVESRRESAETSQSVPENPQINISLLGDFERDINSAYAEVRVPVVSPGQGIPLVNRLELTSAVRYDSISEVGSDLTPGYGVQWRPVSWLMLRGTQNHAFRAPGLNALYRPETRSPTNFDLFGAFGLTFLLPSDPARNNELIDYAVDSIIGGNLDLKPERSVSNNVGIVLELPFKVLEGLSLSADLVEIDYTNRIGGISDQAMLELFPERVIRGAGLQGDPPGMPGRIVLLDRRSVNVAETKIRSLDYQVKYTRPTSVGTFDLRAAATIYDVYEAKSLPTALPISTSYLYPNRYTMQSYWSRGPLGLGISGFYQDQRFNTAARTSLYVKKALEWNAQMAYDFTKAGFNGSGSWMGRMLADTRLSVTIFNIFNTDPPHLEQQGGRVGFAVTDPRMRRYSISLTKSF